MLIEGRHILHPICSAKSVLRKTSLYFGRQIAARQARNIRRGKCDSCWCGGALLPFAWHAGYGVCSNCGCYVNRYPPLPEELEHIYSFDFYWHSRSRLRGHGTIEDRPSIDKRDGRLEYWLNLIERVAARSGRVVEVGCAHGLLLAELKARGYQCVGLEPDPKTAAWTHQNTGLDVRAGFFPDVQLPECDLFLAFDVLEHSPNPLLFLGAVSNLLSPGGIAIIQTPIDRYSFQPPFAERFSDAFSDLEHLFLFTDKAMQQLSRRVGLQIVNQTERLWLHHEICVFEKR